MPRDRDRQEQTFEWLGLAVRNPLRRHPRKRKPRGIFHSQQHPQLPVAQQVRRDGSLITRPLIPEIVSAVEAFPQPGSGTANLVYSQGKKGTSRPVSQRTCSQESRSSQSSRRRDHRNREASPDNPKHEENSDEDSDNEDFGK